MKITNQRRNQILSALVLFLMSAVPVSVSCFYQSYPSALENTDTEPEALSIPKLVVPKASINNAELLREIPEADTEAPWQPSIDTLNLAHYFPENADISDPMSSYAGMAYRELTAYEENWIRHLDELAERNPSVRNVQIALSDGDGNPITSFAGVPEVMSMASVYTYYKDPENYELFLNYAKQLWKESHSCRFHFSDLYHCSGCQTAPESAFEAATPSDSEATPSNAADSDIQNNACPGHVDLIIQVKITGLNGQHNLFALDAIGNDPENVEEGGWPGWNEETMEAARALYAQNWYESYGFSISLVSAAASLSIEEIESYMQALPEDLSQARKELIRFALESVGRVPYYWGGKASRPSYEGNRFGSIVSADPEGRILKGLDCSGWINWVYWSVTGNRLPYESTAGLSAVGTPITKEELQPGDLIFRTGDNAHAILFLGRTPDGKIQCIHESSDVVNNVTISEKNTNWPYYRRLID